MTAKKEIVKLHKVEDECLQRMRVLINETEDKLWTASAIPHLSDDGQQAANVMIGKMAYDKFKNCVVRGMSQ